MTPSSIFLYLFAVWEKVDTLKIQFKKVLQLYLIDDFRLYLINCSGLENTEWQGPLSGVHSVMRVNSARAGEGVGCSCTPFHYIYRHVQSCGML